ncbi:Esterase OVCA2 [Vulpes lagopus]
MAAEQPLRVLALAGFRQSERGFREKTGALRKALRGRAELVCLSGPHLVSGAVGSEGAGPDSEPCLPPEEQPRGWWFSEQEADVFNALSQPTESMQLASRFTGAITLTHPGGHFIPVAAAQRQAYLNFLDQLTE